MGYKFRTAGPWGPGESEDLAPEDVDNNFWQAIQDISAKAIQGVGLSNITQDGNEFTFVLTDHTLLGPYVITLPVPTFSGEWQAEHVYTANTIFTHGGSTYIVLRNHTSAATFDPGANDGNGNDYYGLLLENPSATIPAGGAVGAFLRKAAVSDYVTEWTGASLDDLDDVTLTTPAEGDALIYTSGVWTNSPVVQPIVNLADLEDVLASPAPTSGQVVYWNGSAFSYTTITGSVTGASDVEIAQISSPITNSPLSHRDQLTWDVNESKWVNWPSMAGNQYSSPHTLELNDNGTFVFDGGTTFTIDTNANVPLPFNFNFWIQQPRTGAAIGSGGSSAQVEVTAAGGVTLQVPTGRAAKSRHVGSIVYLRKRQTNTWQISGDLAYVAGVISSLSVNIQFSQFDSPLITHTPTASGNIVATDAPLGHRVTFLFTTSGTTDYTITFSTGFKSQGTLSTGTVSGKVFTVTFIGDGTNMVETSRTTAM